MPEIPNPKLPRPALRPVVRSVTDGPAYAELYCRTNFSFLTGASHPDELVQQAADLGYRALAITDEHSVAGVVRAHAAAKELGLKLLIGAEVTPVDGSPVVLLATDREAYGRLCRLLTVGRRRARKGECELTYEDIAAHSAGLLACVDLRYSAVPRTSPTARRGATDVRRSAPVRRGSPDPADSPTAGLPNVGRPAVDGVARSGDRPQQSGDRPQQSGDRPQQPSPLPLAACHPATPNHRSGTLEWYRDVFGDRAYALAALHHGPNDRAVLEQMVDAARKAGLPLVASNDVHYHVPQRRFLQEVLTAIRHRTTVAELGHRRFANGERYLKSPKQMQQLFAAYPNAIARTAEIADRCTFSLDELRYEYPEELCPPGKTLIGHLRELTMAGARWRYPGGIPDHVRRLLEHELSLIEKLHYESYFLTVWDLVQFARSRGILCQGRGSAANSAVCYCLGVTSVDPDQIDVLFERFVSEERDEAPDIDIDFEHERREEVVQYVYEKYGRERAGMTATVITYRPRSAIRDVGKALGLSLDRVDGLAKALDHYSSGDDLAVRLREQGIDVNSTVGRQLYTLTRELLGFPRHLSQHVGGVVITHRSLCELVPIENASMPGRTVIQWDKDDLDTLGILKVDCLALGMLTALRKSFDLIEQYYRRPLTLAEIPPEDPEVYGMITAADTVGVFQIESRAQMAMHPRLKPKTFYDLVIAVAIVRPGPIQGDMVNPYLRRRAGEEPVEYPDERIKTVLEKTLGVPLFQEQAMKLAITAAGFTPGEADQLRRAMAAWRKTGNIDRFRTKLIEGMQANGYDADFGEKLFGMIRGFGEYGFPESHAASFALLAYASAWLKCHYPDVFTCALLNSQPMGFYAPAQLVRDARQHGVEVRPVDVNFSDWDCTLESVSPQDEQGDGNPSIGGSRASGNASSSIASVGLCPPLAGGGEGAFAIRLGLRMVKGLSEADALKIVRSRRSERFGSFEEFADQTRISQRALTLLSRADAFQSTKENRRQTTWQSYAPREPEPLFEGQPEEPPPPLPEMTPFEEVTFDYNTTGLSLKKHPVSFVRPRLAAQKVTPASALAKYPADRWVKVAGLVLLRQRPSTAKGVTFVTLEDETGLANLIIHQGVWERYRRVARGATLMVASGQLQRHNDVIHVLVRHLQDGSDLLRNVDIKSRDFR